MFTSYPSLRRGILPVFLTVGAVLPVSGEETVEIKVLSFPRQEGKSTIEMLVGEGEVTKIDLQSHEFTLPQKVPRLAKWQFGRSATDSKGQFTFATHARVTPLAAKEQLLLFIRKGHRNKEDFTIIPIDAERVRGRNYLILNLSKGPVAGVVGGKRFKIAPRKRAILKPEADRGEGLCFASLNYQRDGKWRSFFSSNWRLRERSRVLIVVYQTKGQRSPRIHSVVDPL